MPSRAMRRASAAAIAVGRGSGCAPSERPGTETGCGVSAPGEAAVAASDALRSRRGSGSGLPRRHRRQPKLGRGLEGLDSRSMRRVEHGQKGADGDVAKASGRFGRQQGARSMFGARHCGPSAAAAFAPSKSAARAIPFATTRPCTVRLWERTFRSASRRRRHALSHIAKRHVRTGKMALRASPGSGSTIMPPRRQSCLRRCRSPSSFGRGSTGRCRVCGRPGTFVRGNGRGRSEWTRLRFLRACARRRCR